MFSRIAFGLLVVTWTALVVATVAVMKSPTNYCDEFPTPGWQSVFHVAIGLAIGAWVLSALFVAPTGGRFLIAMELATLAAGATVIWLEYHHHVYGGCG